MANKGTDYETLRRLRQAEANASYKPPRQYRGYGSTLPGITRESGIYRTQSPSMAYQESEKLKAEDARDNDNLIRNFANDYQDYMSAIRDITGNGYSRGSATEAAGQSYDAEMEGKYGPQWRSLVPKAQKLMDAEKRGNKGFLGSYSNAGSKRVVPYIQERPSEEQRLERDKARAEAVTNTVKGLNTGKKGSSDLMLPGQTPEQLSAQGMSQKDIDMLMKAGMQAGNTLFPPNNRQPNDDRFGVPSAIQTPYEKAGAFRFPDLHRPDYETKRGKLTQETAVKLKDKIGEMQKRMRSDGASPGMVNQAVERVLGRVDPEVADIVRKGETKGREERKKKTEKRLANARKGWAEQEAAAEKEQSETGGWASSIPKAAARAWPAIKGFVKNAGEEREREKMDAMNRRRNATRREQQGTSEPSPGKIADNLRRFLPQAGPATAPQGGQRLRAFPGYGGRPTPGYGEISRNMPQTGRQPQGQAPSFRPMGPDRLEALSGYGGSVVPQTGAAPRPFVDPTAAAMAARVDPQGGVSKLEQAATAVEDLVNRSGAQGFDMDGVLEELMGVYDWLAQGVGEDVARRQIESLMQRSGLQPDANQLRMPSLMQR